MKKISKYWRYVFLGSILVIFTLVLSSLFFSYVSATNHDYTSVDVAAVSTSFDDPGQTQLRIFGNGTRGCWDPCNPRVPYTFDIDVYGYVVSPLVSTPSQYYPQFSAYPWNYDNVADVSSLSNGTYQACVVAAGPSTVSPPSGLSEANTIDEMCTSFTISRPPPISCGDGVINGTEQCDDGSFSNGTCPATCSATCTINSCPPPTHLECINNTCTSVSGAGSNTCSPVDSACGVPPPPTPTPLQCSPSSQPGAVNVPNWFHTNGTGVAPYTWNASPDGSPFSGDLPDFQTTYTAAGFYTVFLSDSAGGSAQCTVNIPAGPTPTPTPTPNPNLNVALTAIPNSGLNPLSSTLQAVVGGSTTGVITYNFWWNCSNTSNVVATVTTACGTLPSPKSGICAANTVGYKCNSVSATTQTTTAHSYTPVGVYTGKVIISRGAATPAEARTPVTVTSPTPTPAPADYTVSGLATAPGPVTVGQLVSFSATINNTGAGNGTVSTQTRARLNINNSGPYDLTFTNQTTGALNTGANEVETWSNVWTAEVGTHRFEICADNTTQIAESNETNNCTEGTFTVDLGNQPPVVLSVTITEPDYCLTGPGVVVNWTYSDPEGDAQSAYQIQIDDTGSAWNLPLFLDTGKVVGNGTSYFAPNGILAFNKTYKTRVMVWDSNDLASAWKESASWKTPKHSYPTFPNPPFNYSPAKPQMGLPVSFTDAAVCYDDNNNPDTCDEWSWTFGDGGSSTAQNPSHVYNSTGAFSVVEAVTDVDKNECTRSRSVNIQRPLPIWKEAIPK